MFKVFVIKRVPEQVYICKTERYEQTLKSRGLHKEDVMSQELSFESLLLLTEGKSNVVMLYLYK